MSEVNAPDIIEMGRTMNAETRRKRLEADVQLVQEWKLSEMTQVEFAAAKGITVRALEYRIRKVRNEVPEMLSDAALAEVEFIPVPGEYVNACNRMDRENPMSEQPVLMLQTSSASLQATNQINPCLLKTALEVMLTC